MLTRRLNRALEAELSEHLGYEPGQAPPGGRECARRKVEDDPDRCGTAADPLPPDARAREPQIVRKRQTRWAPTIT